ncbi:MAG: hypothetical protein ACYTFG_02820 [Planctomycetota bacterium]|jgi:hypothetical protein
MNKEQWTFLAGVALFLLGGYFTATGWMPEKQFQPPTIKQKKGPEEAPPVEATIFASEDDLSEFRPRGRDPFIPKRDTEPLPLAELRKPPMPDLKRVAPGPMPGLGHSRLRPLEETVPKDPIDLTGGPGTEGGEGGEEEEDDEWGNRRY